MKGVFSLLAVFAALTLLAAPAAADWNDGDPYKMHFPQRPDPNGLDVDIWNAPVGDDWTCSATGPVSDIHFWYSWFGDRVARIDSVTVQIYDNEPAVGGPDPLPSRPKDLQWERTFGEGEFTTRYFGSGDQGWFSPRSFSDPILNDHAEYHQLNITGIKDPFEQTEGEIYWLVLDATVDPGSTEFIGLGWKTSLDRHQDAAVFLLSPDNPVWSVVDPPNVGPVNMAFVITPEPSTWILLGMGVVSLGACAWRKRRRR
jgi:hypothetical protein